MTIQNKNIIKIGDEYGVEQEITGFDEETYVEKLPPPKKIIVEVTTKSSRCKHTVDWVEVEYGDSYEKPHVNEKGTSGKQSISSTLVKQMTKSEIESLRQNKRDAYALMMKMN